MEEDQPIQNCLDGCGIEPPPFQEVDLNLQEDILDIKSQALGAAAHIIDRIMTVCAKTLRINDLLEGSDAHAIDSVF